ncbi:MAG: S1 RNA-binding domain-containing protein [Bdellovibrionota bacterium]
MVSDIKINWEDDDGSFEAEFKASKNTSGSGDEDFSNMLSSEVVRSTRGFAVGDKVTGIICSLNGVAKDIAIELGGKLSAVIAREELCDSEGKLIYSEGDSITSFIVSKSGGEIILSNSMKQSAARENAIESAFVSKVPVRGKVEKVNKGGFDIKLMGKTAFCPISKIDLKFVDDGKKESYLGKEFDFIIEKLAGRDIVVSRRALLEVQQSAALEQLVEAMKKEVILDGVVEEIRDFGAIVSVNGVSGMVHISEVSHSRLEKVEEGVQVGQNIRVKVLSIEERNGKQRIALSIKQAGNDPWDTITERVSVDQSFVAKVKRLEVFGAFVEIEPGIEGLIHISEMSWFKRINHPKELLKVGDVVNVRVLAVDSNSRRISLTMKSIEDDPWIVAKRDLQEGLSLQVPIQSLKPFGVIVELRPGVTGVVPLKALKAAFGDSFRKKSAPGIMLDVVIAKIDFSERNIYLTLPNISDDDNGIDAYEDYLRKKREKKLEESKSSDALGSFGELLKQSLTKSKY